MKWKIAGLNIQILINYWYEKSIQNRDLAFCLITAVGYTYFLDMQAKEAVKDYSVCEKDSDCVLVADRRDNLPCCWNCGYEAITKTAFEKREIWEEENCKEFNQNQCFALFSAAPVGAIKMFKAVCQDNRCKRVQNT